MLLFNARPAMRAARLAQKNFAACPQTSRRRSSLANTMACNATRRCAITAHDDAAGIATGTYDIAIFRAKDCRYLSSAAQHPLAKVYHDIAPPTFDDIYTHTPIREYEIRRRHRP